MPTAVGLWAARICSQRCLMRPYAPEAGRAREVRVCSVGRRAASLEEPGVQTEDRQHALGSQCLVERRVVMDAQPLCGQQSTRSNQKRRVARATWAWEVEGTRAMNPEGYIWSTFVAHEQKNTFRNHRSDTDCDLAVTDIGTFSAKFLR